MTTVVVFSSFSCSSLILSNSINVIIHSKAPYMIHLKCLHYYYYFTFFEIWSAYCDERPSDVDIMERSCSSLLFSRLEQRSQWKGRSCSIGAGISCMEAAVSNWTARQGQEREEDGRKRTVKARQLAEAAAAAASNRSPESALHRNRSKPRSRAALTRFRLYKTARFYVSVSRVWCSVVQKNRCGWGTDLFGAIGCYSHSFLVLSCVNYFLVWVIQIDFCAGPLSRDLVWMHVCANAEVFCLFTFASD